MGSNVWVRALLGLVSTLPALAVWGALGSHITCAAVILCMGCSLPSSSWPCCSCLRCLVVRPVHHPLLQWMKTAIALACMSELSLAISALLRTSHQPLIQLPRELCRGAFGGRCPARPYRTLRKSCSACCTSCAMRPLTRSPPGAACCAMPRCYGTRHDYLLGTCACFPMRL